MSRSNLRFDDTQPESLLAYIQSFVAAPDNNAKTLIYGGTRKLQEQLQNLGQEDYPILHLERPNILTESNGHNFNEIFYCSFNCYVKFRTDGEPTENDASERLAEETSLNVLRNLQKHLHHEAAKGIIEFNIDGGSIDPVLDNFVPNHLGWQLNVKIGMNANAKLC